MFNARAAGLTAFSSSLTAWRTTVNRAWPHGRRNGPIIGVGDQQLLDTGAPVEYGSEPPSQVAPAGGIAASANDMARWVQIQLARGTIPGGSARLFSEVSSRNVGAGRQHADPPVSPVRSPGPRRSF
jgi:CubicO group peptidase (beta-lactamase class C family)